MRVLAIIILVIVGVLLLASIIKKKPVPSAKVIVLLAIVGGGMFAVTSYFGNGSPEVEVPYYQEKAPSLVDAPYMLITDTRTYYINEYYQNDQYLTLQRFYYFDHKIWEQSDMPLALDKSIPEYSDLKVIKRGG